MRKKRQKKRNRLYRNQRYIQGGGHFALVPNSKGGPKATKTLKISSYKGWLKCDQPQI
jgi:hypothetical protein